MATQLINILRFTGLTVGVPAVLPHELNQDGRGLIPDVILPMSGDYTITGDDTDVTIIRGPIGNEDVDVLVFQWHTVLREFGPYNPPPNSSPNGNLLPQPFVVEVGTMGAGIPLCNILPLDVDKSAASAGIAVDGSRCDHKHDILTAAPPQGIGGGDSEGVATTLSRSDHDHTIRETGGPTDLTVGAIADGEVVIRSGGSLVGSAVAAGGSGVLIWGTDSIAAAADTRFLSPGYDDTPAITTDTRQFHVPRPGTLKNLFVRHNVAGGNGNSVDYTVLVNGAATLITVSLATGAVGSASDLANTVAVVQGDRISLQADKSLSIGGGDIELVVSLEFE